MKHFIPLASPDIRNEDVESVSQVLHSGNLVQGKQIELLEKKLADYLGVPHCIMLSNGTSSLHLSLIALGIGKGDEVIVPAFSYIATANSVELTGANPVFVDIDIDTFNIYISLLKLIQNQVIFSNIEDQINSKIEDELIDIKKFHVEQLS